MLCCEEGEYCTWRITALRSSTSEAIRPFLLRWSIQVARLPPIRLEKRDWSDSMLRVRFTERLVANLVMVDVSNMVLQCGRRWWIYECVDIPYWPVG